MSKTKAKAKAKRQQQLRPARQQRRPPSGPDLPVMPIAFGLAILAVLVGLLIFAKVNSGTAGDNTATVDGIKCDALEMTAVHYHAHLTILNAGQPVSVPGNVGRPSCYYWLHTHDSQGDEGTIHVEAPNNGRTYTLGNFFDVWREPLSSSNVAGIKLQSGQSLVVFVDGQQYSGDPRAIPLKAHEQIVLEITPPQLPPPTWNFPAQE